MSERDCLLNMDGWVRNRINMKVDQLRQFGPTLEIEIGQPGAPVNKARAQIDTGASHSCVGPAIAAKLGAPTGKLLQHAAGREPEDTPMHRCSVRLHNGTQFDADFAVLAHLHQDHDVLIGRDVLQFCRVVVDFTSGQWELHIRTDAHA